MKPLPLRARLTAWYSLVLAVILMVFALTVTWEQGRVGLRRLDRELDNLTLTLSSLLRDELSEMPNPQGAAQEVQHTVAAIGREIAILTADGQVLASNPKDSAQLSKRALGAPDRRTWATTTSDGRWRTAARRATIAGGEYVLLAAAPLADAMRERREAQEAMWLGMPLLLLLSAAGGFWLASVALRPITEMARRAAQLPVTGGEDLGQSGRRDELGQLERAFNDLLARLRTTLAAQRQFMADASHELRTPVSVMRSAADVALDRPHRDESEYREALGLVASQSQQVSRLLEDMLMLARADAGGYPLRPVSLYLNELAQSCADSLSGLARRRGVAMQVTAPSDVPFVGDEDLLRRMFSNLLLNAVQHTRPGGRVEIAVTIDADLLTIAVADQGKGIAEPDRTRIFDRFVQLDPARRRSGAGLGLPISRWIVEAHGGRLELQTTSESGSVFVGLFPHPGSPL
jgi:two-component system OmpR family sensor kinase